MSGRLTAALYRTAWRCTRYLPTWLGYGLAHAGADVAWTVHRLRPTRTGVGQLERNLARLLPADTTARALHRASRAAMRSYMRYFYEAFALPSMSLEQVMARVRADVPESLRQDARDGSVVLALPHMGNWDLVGTWACQELAQVLTVAERLEPADLFDQFVRFRQGQGMRIIGQAPGEKVFEHLVGTASRGHYAVALLADRDLSASGVLADLAGHRARVAAGPAAIAQRLGLPLYAVTVGYEPLTGERRRRAGSRWGLYVRACHVPAPEGLDGRAQVEAWTRRWVSALAPDLAAHATDWHMLQPVFDADLDQERLARSHARQGGAATADPAASRHLQEGSA